MNLHVAWALVTWFGKSCCFSSGGLTSCTPGDVFSLSFSVPVSFSFCSGLSMTPVEMAFLSSLNLLMHVQCSGQELVHRKHSIHISCCNCCFYLESLRVSPPSLPLLVVVPGEMGEQTVPRDEERGHWLSLFSPVRRSQKICRSPKVKANSCPVIPRGHFFRSIWSILLLTLTGGLGSKR